VAPPTLNLDNPDPACTLNCVPNTPQERRIDVFLNDSFGFGGHNAVLIGRRFRG
jgi:3-oxoacyl-[acyl-carrier-protein] synthase II